MKKRVFAAVVASVVLMSSAVWASGPPYTVSVGGSSVAGSHPFSAATPRPNQVNIAIKNSAGTVLGISCAGLTMSGTIAAGSAINPVLNIASSTWSGCTMPAGMFAMTASGAWNVSGSGSNATTGTETVAGSVNGMVLNSSFISGTYCTFKIMGHANASVDEAAQRLVVSETGFTGNLFLVNATCPAAGLTTGNPVNLQAALDLASPEGPLDLS